MIVSFSDLFEDNGNDIYTPKHKVKLGGITIWPGAFSLKPGVSFSGVDIAEYVGRDLKVEQYDDGTMAILEIL